MIDLSVEIAGISFRNPVLTAAGPNSGDGGTLLQAAKHGAGGLVAKTISIKPADVPRPCVISVDRARIQKSLLNCELWSDITYEQWIEKEYRIAKSSGLPVIASIGYSSNEVSKLGKLVEKAGIDGIEFSLHYVGTDLKPIIDVAKTLRESVDIPIFAKVSPHLENLAMFAKELEKVDVNGVVAINSLGPCLHIDVNTGKPFLGGEHSFGWLSGSAIRPLGVRCVAQIAKAVDIPIIGVGGVMRGVDAIEYIMVGASAIQICTGAILEGPSIYGRVVKEIKEFLVEHNYDSIEEVRGIALRHIKAEVLRTKAVPPKIDESLCTGCGICKRSCVNSAVKIVERKACVDEKRCYGCGLCVSICPVRAIDFKDFI